MASLGSSLETAGSWKLLTGSLLAGSVLTSAASPGSTKHTLAMNLALAPLELGVWGVLGAVAGRVRGESAKKKTRGVGTLAITAMNTANITNHIAGNLVTSNQAEQQAQAATDGGYGPNYGIN